MKRTNQKIEKLVVKYTKILHPEDKGKGTRNLEIELRNMCEDLISDIIVSILENFKHTTLTKMYIDEK